MTGNRSLDEFLPTEDEGSGAEEPEPEEQAVREQESGEQGAEEPAADDADADSRSDVEPMAPTYESSPEGTPCESCGETVEERWRDGDVMVCAGCKEW